MWTSFSSSNALPAWHTQYLSHCSGSANIPDSSGHSNLAAAARPGVARPAASSSQPAGRVMAASHVRWSGGCGHVTAASRVPAAHITVVTCRVSLLSRRCAPRGGRGATAAVRWLLLRCCQVVVAGLHCSSGRLLISGAHVSAALCLAPPKGYGEGSIKYCSTPRHQHLPNHWQISKQGQRVL